MNRRTFVSRSIAFLFGMQQTYSSSGDHTRSVSPASMAGVTRGVWANPAKILPRSSLPLDDSHDVRPNRKWATNDSPNVAGSAVRGCCVLLQRVPEKGLASVSSTEIQEFIKGQVDERI